MKLIGFYQEMDPGYRESWGGPAPRPDSGAGTYPVGDVVGYLKSGYSILDVMESTVDVIGGSFRVPGGSSVLTDGCFVWRVDLSSYVGRYRIDLPREFLETIHGYGYRIPQVTHEALLGISVGVSRVLGFGAGSPAGPA
ncbi:hypothetical protein [Streptomyces sp. NBC_00557]|uniref:hypothetical protein n=1 Tax=Streptomyces sp. NBC_00557 TaxID=2975776 RepID=UPI002E805CD9|nr:hypothetical protein [Streptomyces sp. NBC_00557]WUC34412.1 hypothetical protein OG956_09420 [Streptomyces sp. NBC_00557]